MVVRITAERLGGFGIERIYPPQARRALDALREQWVKTKPLHGITVLDGTPLFRNTLLKYEVLLAGGAEVYAGYSEAVPYDPAVVQALRRDGEASEGVAFDVILDCAGAHAQLPSRYGYVELTRSGLEVYKDVDAPVYFADGGQVKLLETSLGTGDGLVRGLRAFGIEVLRGKRMAVVGCGKVGSGILFRLKQEGVECFAVEREGVSAPFDVPMVCIDRLEALLPKLDGVITATGVKGALAGCCRPQALEGLILANMGVEDEFGEAVPEAWVLNDKRPLNFVLEEPTQLRYIDPTMALHNLGALRLVRGLPKGVHLPTLEDEAPLLDALEPSVRAELELFMAALAE